MTTDHPNNGGERHSDLAVMDANEYKQKRRLERILDAHDNVEDQAQAAFEQYAYGQITEHAKNIVLLQAVKKYIREVYNLLREHEHDRETTPDDEPTPPSYLHRTGEPLGEINREHDPDIAFVSLRDVLAADMTYTETWSETTTTRHGFTEEVTHDRQYSVPDSVSWNAYLLVNEFLSREHDLELRFEELDDSLPTWGFEEVPDEPGTEVHSEQYDPEKTYGPKTEAADGDD